MTRVKLFTNLEKGDRFHFGDKPGRILIKSDANHYVAPEGRRMINPHVAVFRNPSISATSTFTKLGDGMKGS